MSRAECLPKHTSFSTQNFVACHRDGSKHVAVNTQPLCAGNLLPRQV